jgi:hypothetical protein
MMRPSFMAQLRMPLIASPSAAEPMCVPPVFLQGALGSAPYESRAIRLECTSIHDRHITLQYFTYRNEK